MDEIDTSQQNTSNDDAESNDEHVSTEKKPKKNTLKSLCVRVRLHLSVCCQKMSSVIYA